MHEGGILFWPGVHWHNGQRIAGFCPSCHKAFRPRQKLVRREGQVFHPECWRERQY